MSKTELIDSHVSLKQCKLAVVTLHDHESKKEEKRQETELIAGKEQNVWLIVNVKKIQGTHRFKPTKIPIAYPLVDPRTTPVCLITKDPQREYKDLLEANGVKFISRVVGLLKLQGKFKPYEARRMLLKENGMFLADERVIPKLPKLLGSKWFEAKKQPIPVCLTRKNIKEELERAISSTYMNQNQGTCTSIKIGILSQTPTQILANIQKGLPVIIKNIKGGWDNIQSLQIKTNSSVSLPIWTCALDESEGGRWNGLTAVADSEEEGSELEDDSEMEVDVVEKKEEKKGKGKGKRMAAEDQDDEEETMKPKKKVKGAEGKTSPVSAAQTSATPTKKASAPTDPPASSQKPAATVMPVETSGPKKARKARKPKNDPEPTAEVEVVAEPVAEPATAASKPKKTKKSRASDVAVAPPADVVVPPIAEPEVTSPVPVKAKKEKRKAKAKASEVSTEVPATTDTPAVESSTVEATVEATDSSLPKKKLNKKAKSRLAAGAATESVEAPSPAAESVPVPSTVTEVTETGKKSKRKAKKAKSEDAAAVAVETTVVVEAKTEAPTLTKEELKQKKSGGAGEKKKEKVVKSKGKSAKDAIIGKKIAQG